MRKHSKAIKMTKVIKRVQNSEENKGHIKRNLKARHMTMIAIGGSIGTGLFLATGSSIQTAGPGGALIAYGVIGIMV